MIVCTCTSITTSPMRLLELRQQTKIQRRHQTSAMLHLFWDTIYIYRCQRCSLFAFLLTKMCMQSSLPWLIEIKYAFDRQNKLGKFVAVYKYHSRAMPIIHPFYLILEIFARAVFLSPWKIQIDLQNEASQQKIYKIRDAKKLCINLSGLLNLSSGCHPAANVKNLLHKNDKFPNRIKLDTMFNNVMEVEVKPSTIKGYFNTRNTITDQLTLHQCR